MKITQAWIKKYNPCEEGIEWFEGQKETDGIEVVKALIKDNHTDWANWAIVRIMNRKQRIWYACYAHNLVSYAEPPYEAESVYDVINPVHAASVYHIFDPTVGNATMKKILKYGINVLEEKP